MKKRFQHTLSPLQQRRFVKILVLLAIAAVGWIFFAPDMGIYSLYSQKNRVEKLQEKKSKLEAENAALRREIKRIENDVEYLERLAREKHGLLKENEMVFDFGENSTSD
jgi:cell division protein FtsB